MAAKRLDAVEKPTIHEYFVVAAKEGGANYRLLQKISLTKAPRDRVIALFYNCDDAIAAAAFFNAAWKLNAIPF